jgi:putative methionine-R-sulfoxide reductase with GAF domain
MKLSNKTIIISLVITFVILTAYTAYELMALAENISRKVGVTEVAKINLAKEVTKLPYNLLLADFFVVLLLIFFFTAASFQQKQVAVNEGMNLKYRQNANAREEDEDEDNEQQEWLDKFKLLLSQEKGSSLLCNKALTMLCKKLEACTGAFYLANQQQATRFIEFVAGYAFILPDSQVLRYEYGEGIAGQSAKSGKEAILNNVPDGYIKVFSGLGEATPRHLFVCPLLQNGQTIAVMEIATFISLSKKQLELTREAGRLLTIAVQQETETRVNTAFS